LKEGKKFEQENGIMWLLNINKTVIAYSG
jgi:hypothetical protein